MGLLIRSLQNKFTDELYLQLIFLFSEIDIPFNNHMEDGIFFTITNTSLLQRKKEEKNSRTVRVSLL